MTIIDHTKSCSQVFLLFKYPKGPISHGRESGWQQVRTYADHLGHRVVLEQYVVPDPEPDHLVPIQVYSLVPLDSIDQRYNHFYIHYLNMTHV